MGELFYTVTVSWEAESEDKKGRSVSKTMKEKYMTSDSTVEGAAARVITYLEKQGVTGVTVQAVSNAKLVAFVD